MLDGLITARKKRMENWKKQAKKIVSNRVVVKVLAFGRSGITHQVIEKRKEKKKG